MTNSGDLQIETTSTVHGSRRRVTLVRHGVSPEAGAVNDDHRTTAGKTPRDWSAWFRRLAWLTRNDAMDDDATTPDTEVEYR
jgi:hypothetical protein